MSISLADARALAAEVDGEVIRYRTGYAVEVPDSSGSSSLIFSFEDLRYIPNRAHRAVGGKALSRGEANDLAREVEGSVVPFRTGYAVEVFSSDGHPELILSLRDLQFIPNRRK